MDYFLAVPEPYWVVRASKVRVDTGFADMVAAACTAEARVSHAVTIEPNFDVAVIATDDLSAPRFSVNICPTDEAP